MATLFSTVLAIPVSFFAAHNIMHRVPGGTAIYYITRSILNVVRAVDTVVWGLIIIVWVGLGSFAGVIALTIHSIAALASSSPRRSSISIQVRLKAIEAMGRKLLAVIRYAEIPQIIPSFTPPRSALDFNMLFRPSSVSWLVAASASLCWRPSARADISNTRQRCGRLQ